MDHANCVSAFHPDSGASFHDERASQFYQPDVTDRVRSPWKLPADLRR